MDIKTPSELGFKEIDEHKRAIEALYKLMQVPFAPDNKPKNTKIVKPKESK